MYAFFSLLDLNECSVAADSCNLNASTCQNLHGSYQCNCHNGYTSVNSVTCKGSGKAVWIIGCGPVD